MVVDPDNKNRIKEALKAKKVAEDAEQVANRMAAEAAQRRRDAAEAFFKNVVHPTLDHIRDEMTAEGVHLNTARNSKHRPGETAQGDLVGRIWAGGTKPTIEVSVAWVKSEETVYVADDSYRQTGILLPFNVTAARLEQEVTKLLAGGLGPKQRA